ncbi:MAG: pyruvate kinase [Spirochaetaceae bacterium]
MAKISFVDAESSIFGRDKFFGGDYSGAVLMEYKVVATLGPATARPESWWELRNAGATGFRLNTSHLLPEETEEWLSRLSDSFGDDLPSVVLDLQGSKWRIGDISTRTVAPGDSVTLAYRRDTILEDSLPGVVPVPHRDFFRALEDADGTVLLNDAKVELVVDTLREYQAFCRVIRGGSLESRKGVTVPGSAYRSEALQDRDQEIVRRTRGHPGVTYALSYVRDAAEMRAFRDDLGPGIRSIAKIERQEAVTAAPAIARESEELWLCRGDLGAEVGMAEMARAVHEFYGLLPQIGPPTLLAGQVLEHMARHPEPTRSEVCHLYDALAFGFSGIVLSDETAVGAHPVEACKAAALFRPLI